MVVEETILIFGGRMFSPFLPMKESSVHPYSWEVIPSQMVYNNTKESKKLKFLWNVSTFAQFHLAITFGNLSWFITFTLHSIFNSLYLWWKTPIWNFVLNNWCLCLVLYDFCVPTVFFYNFISQLNLKVFK